LFKKFQKEGLVSLYENGTTKALLRSFVGIAFLPVNEVVVGFQELVDEVEMKIAAGIIPEGKVEALRGNSFSCFSLN